MPTALKPAVGRKHLAAQGLLRMLEERGRLLGVDPGEKRIGLAISDVTQTLARPLAVLRHVARATDAGQIARAAGEQDAVGIIVGVALDSEGLPGPQAKLAERLAEAIRACTSLPVTLWDESGSTQAAQSIALQVGKPRNKRRGHLDDQAAAVLLQSYLDALHTDLAQGQTAQPDDC